MHKFCFVVFRSAQSEKTKRIVGSQREPKSRRVINVCMSYLSFIVLHGTFILHVFSNPRSSRLGETSISCPGHTMLHPTSAFAFYIF
jgi:hypothetical protein